MELNHILYPVEKVKFSLKKIVCPIKILPLPQKFSISIKKLKKKKKKVLARPYLCQPKIQRTKNQFCVALQ